MHSDNLTLGRRCVEERFPQYVAKYLRDEAEAARAAYGHSRSGSRESINRHATMLNGLANYVQAVGPYDQRVVAIADCQPHPRAFEPGPQQTKMIAWLAMGTTPAVEPADALVELSAVAVQDLKDRLAGELDAAQSASRREIKELRAKFAPREDVERLERELSETRAQLSAAQSELAEATRVADFLGRLHDQQPPATSERRPDRVPVEGEDHIYSRVLADDSTSYIVRFKVDGKARWETVGPDLDEARRRRDALIEQGVIKARASAVAA